MPPAPMPAIDPLDRVYKLGQRESIAGGVVGILLACSTHVALIVCAITLLQGQRAMAATTSELEIEVAPAATTPPPPPPPPEPVNTVSEPIPAPPKADKPAKEDPYEDDDIPPPPPSEAAKVLTAPEDPKDPPAPSDQTFASGNGTGLGIGFVAGSGSGNGTTFDPRARVGNKPPPAPTTGGTGDGVPDLSRRASPYYGASSGCDFPDGVDGETGVVTVVVTVGPDGRALAVEIVDAPVKGFDNAARSCAMRTKYRPGRDAKGTNIVTKTLPVRIRFMR